ncbi:hypothetical protein ABZ234_08220 [Nocardiopsis sp. NPDC006198]|uniref:hypothetical protein n=1 Tax=Nocardiopsis sp. NPDC006198 TaxID=3154472 RepID=UPI0033AA11EA
MVTEATVQHSGVDSAAGWLAAHPETALTETGACDLLLRRGAFPGASTPLSRGRVTAPAPDAATVILPARRELLRQMAAHTSTNADPDAQPYVADQLAGQVLTGHGGPSPGS